MKPCWQDGHLSRLPIPTLEKTCDTICEIATPFVETLEEQHALVTDLEILAKDGQALQQRLLKRQQYLGSNSSWLRPIWEDSYSANPTPVAGLSNYAFELNQVTLKTEYPLEQLILGIAHQALSIDDKTFSPEKIGKQFLCMEMFHHAFYTRIPGERQSVLQRCLIKGTIRIAVVFKEKWYLVTIADESQGLIPLASLVACLNRIRQGLVSGATKSLIGAMTTMSATAASRFRNELQVEQVNRLSLKSLEETLFTVTLAEPTPTFGSDPFVFGEAENRWFFKSLQVIELTNGKIGLNFEHSGCDGSHWLYLLNQLVVSQPSQPKQGLWVSSTIHPLRWEFTLEMTEQLRQHVCDFKNQSLRYYTERVTDASLSRQLFKGKYASPDACLQLALIAAYYHQKTCFPSIYESVSMRHYYEGRTEVARPMTNEAYYFITTLVQRKNSDKMTLELLLKAIEAHKKRLKQIQRGHGAERHLLGLLSEINNLTDERSLAILQNKAFKRAIKNNLSTSSLASPMVAQFIFSPVSENGLGIGYGLLTTGLQLAITGREADRLAIEEYGQLVRVYLQKMAELLKKVPD